MKTQLIIYPAMLALLFAGCDEKKDDNANESVIEAQNEISGEQHEDDTSMVKHDGTLLPDAVDQMDSVALPASVREKINQDAMSLNREITGSREFTENGQTYYEVSFRSEKEGATKVIYDATGKIKPQNN